MDGVARQQSPIEIDRAWVEVRDGLGGVQVRYPAGSVAVEVSFGVVDGDDTPHGTVVVPQLICVPAPSGAHVLLGDDRYDLQSFHWHGPSEHLVDGDRLPLELHLVHRSEDDRLLVVAVLSAVGPVDDALAPAFDLIPLLRDRGPGGSPHRVEMRLAELVTQNPRTYRYTGSLTTAPFTGGVTWVIDTVVRSASAGQIDAHRVLVSTPLPEYAGRPQPRGNARFPQGIDGRIVVTEG